MAAFLVTAVSGLVLTVPQALIPFFGIPLLEWRTVHKWSALVLTAALVVHLVANRRRSARWSARLRRPAGPPRSAGCRSQPRCKRMPGHKTPPKNPKNGCPI